MHIPVTKFRLLREIAIEIKCTSNYRELRESSDVLQHGIIRNLVAGVDRSELWEGDVGQFRVVNENKTPNCSKIGRREALHGVAVETQVLSDVGQGWERDRAAVTESHVCCSFEHGEGCHKAGHIAIIGLDIQWVLDTSHLQADVLQCLVVVDIEGRNWLQVVDTLKRAQTRVGNEDAVSLTDTCAAKGHLLQCWESCEIQRADGRKLRERELRQDC